MVAIGVSTGPKAIRRTHLHKGVDNLRKPCYTNLKVKEKTKKALEYNLQLTKIVVRYSNAAIGTYSFRTTPSDFCGAKGVLYGTK